MVSRTDVFVVGGGPAGLAAGIALRAKGFDVTIADPSRPPIDKTCGEGLMPGALAALEQLGVALSPAQGHPFRGIRFLGQNTSVDSCFPEGFCTKRENRLYQSDGLGIRRTHLHRALVDRAAAVGVKMLWGAPVRALQADRIVLGDCTVGSRWIIGADGENSRVRHWAGLDGAWTESRRFGFRRHFRVAPDSVGHGGFMEIYWAHGCQGYVTPISPDEVCVVAMSRDAHLRFDEVLRRLPTLRQKLNGAIAITTERGAVSASRILRRVYRGNIALIGDASGSVDAITGEGLRLSFEQSLALADALVEENLRSYQAAHWRLALRPSFLSRMMLSLDWSDVFRERVLKTFAREPELFRDLLAAHVGALTPARFLHQGIIPLTRGILPHSFRFHL